MRTSPRGRCRIALRMLVTTAAAVFWTAVIGYQTRTVSAAPPQSESSDALARQVYQIFTQQCIKCHGPAKAGGLDLRTEEGLRKGGVSGPVVVPHKPEDSDLFKYVSHLEQPFMPAPT